EDISSWGERHLDTDFVSFLAYPQLGAFYGSLPAETSAGFYHMLARHGMDVSLYAVAGGAGKVPERLAEIVRSNGEVRTGAEVTGLEVGSGGVEVRIGTEARSFDGAISAVPAPVLRRMAGGLPSALAQW